MGPELLLLLDDVDAELVFPVCHEHGLGYEAFGPLAGGWLTGKYRRGETYPEGSRMTQRPDSYLRYANDTVFDALDALASEAAARDVSSAGLALAWVLGVPEVTAVVLGPTHAEHLSSSGGALARAEPGGACRSERLVPMSLLVLSEHDVRQLLDMGRASRR